MKNIIFRKDVVKYFDFESRREVKRVTFTPLPGRFVPEFGRDPRKARQLYAEIANCPKCDHGMGGHWYEVRTPYGVRHFYKETGICPLHRAETEV